MSRQGLECNVRAAAAASSGWLLVNVGFLFVIAGDITWFVQQLLIVSLFMFTASLRSRKHRHVSDY
jgi:heme/copper-type cytochrome/quinol oxidase subunit 2